jgi:predicted transcriptional regulator
MTTLRVGIASYDEMKALTLAIARGQRKLAPREPRIWFPTTESFAKVLSADNRDLLRVIAEKKPGSLEELAQLTGRAKSNLSRTLKTMVNYGLVRLERGPRRRIAAKVVHDRIELELPLVRKEVAA